MGDTRRSLTVVSIHARYAPKHRRRRSRRDLLCASRFARLVSAVALMIAYLQVVELPAFGAALTSTSWSMTSTAAGGTGAGYTWGFTTATTSTLSKVTMGVPAGTSCTNRYLALNGGNNGNYASTPDSAANSVTGDIDLRAKLNLVN